MCVRGSVLDVPLSRTPLETPRLVVRPFDPRDVSLTTAALRANAARLGRSGDETLTRTATWIAAEHDAWERGERHSFAILPREPRKTSLWGQITIGDVLRGARQCASLGFWVDAAMEGRGIAHEALTCVLALAFEPLALHRIEAAVLPENQRSQRLLERLGFRVEGCARGYLALAGVWTDHLLYARLASDP